MLQSCRRDPAEPAVKSLLGFSPVPLLSPTPRCFLLGGKFFGVPCTGALLAKPARGAPAERSLPCQTQFPALVCRPLKRARHGCAVLFPTPGMGPQPPGRPGACTVYQSRALPRPPCSLRPWVSLGLGAAPEADPVPSSCTRRACSLMSLEGGQASYSDEVLVTLPDQARLVHARVGKVLPEQHRAPVPTAAGSVKGRGWAGSWAGCCRQSQSQGCISH